MSVPNGEHSSEINEEEPVVLLDTQFLFQTAGGEVSKSHLDTRQLCKMLTSHVGHIKASTNVLLRNPDGTYVSSWKPVSQTPVLRDASALWYTSSGNETVGAPESCRELVKKNPKYYLSAVTDSQWKTLDELPNLALALEALQESNDMQKQTAIELLLQEKKQKENDESDEELESFLESTQNEHVNGIESKKEKDPLPQRGPEQNKRDTPSEPEKAKRKPKRAKFSSRNRRCWIYVTGLPSDCTEAEIEERFAKAGVLDLDPETFKPKIKLYRDKTTNEIKGDASICFARPESVELAITLYDGLALRLGEQKPILSVQHAIFEQHGDYQNNKQHISIAKRKVVKLAAQQAMDWDAGEYNGRLTGGRKGLRIIVLKHLFDPSQFTPDTEDQVLADLEKKLHAECEEVGTVEKITVFSKNPDGVVVVKFKEPAAASEAVKQYNNRTFNNRSVEASFWDGVTDYTVKDEVKEAEDQEKRIEEFGNWLETQELPDELKPRIE